MHPSIHISNKPNKIRKKNHEYISLLIPVSDKLCLTVKINKKINPCSDCTKIGPRVESNTITDTPVSLSVETALLYRANSHLTLFD